MSRGLRLRLLAFAVISAIGITAISAKYLGLVDALLGRGYSVTAALPASGGLFVGSQVTYRGVQVGEVVDMRLGDDGVDVELRMEDAARIPDASPIFVHNGSAVGEQYLDFEPRTDHGPFLGDGDEVSGGWDALPVGEDELLVSLDDFVGSVDTGDLATVVEELGLAFYDTGRVLQRLLDGGSAFLDEAEGSKKQTISLLDTGRTVLATQRARAGDIRAFAHGLRQVSSALSASDRDLRVLLEGGPATAEQVRLLLEGMEPTLPVFLSNLVTISEVTTARLDGAEQLLITFPNMIAGGFAGTTSDGYGYVNLQWGQDPPPCTDGYLPPNRWRSTSDTKDGKVYLKAHCESPPPINVRGVKHAPQPNDHPARVAPYDPRTGVVEDGGRRVVVDDGSAVNIYREDAWKWILLGPVSQ
jgi:phospholipid/cholesterol/gamma-HCH transport system substrate-binding protein